MNSEDKKHIFLSVIGLCVMLIICVISFWVPNVTLETSWGTINILLLVAFVFGALFFLLAICWGRQKSWIVPGVFLLSMGLIISFIILYSHLIKKVQEDSSNANNILKTVQIVLTIFAVIVAIFGLFFARKIEQLGEIEKYAKEAPKMATISAELAFYSLPDFSRSHQIPQGLDKVLKEICEKVFVPESPLLRYLERVGNGAVLHYAMGLYLFSEGDYSGAVSEFRNVLDMKLAANDMKNSALYRLGITYRQEKRYYESIFFFTEQYKSAIGDKIASLQSRYGISLTLYAIHQDQENRNFWRNHREDIAKLINGIFEVAHVLETLPENLAFEILRGVVDEQPSNYSAILYLARFYIAHPDLPWFNIREKEELKRLIGELLRFLKEVPSSLNIKANYLVVEATCYLCLFRMCPREDDYKGRAKRALTSALFTAEEYENIDKRVSIFSDVQVRQISVNDFIREIREMARNNNIALPL